MVEKKPELVQVLDRGKVAAPGARAKHTNHFSNGNNVPFECQLTDIVESIPAGFMMFDAADRLVVCNSRYLEWFFPENSHLIIPGMSYEELLMVFAESELSVDASEDPTWFQKRLAERGTPDGSFKHRLKGGRVVHSSEQVTSDGNVISIHVDMTELHEQKTASEKKSEQFRVIMETINQGISMMDADLNCVVANDRFHELLGFPEELGASGTPFEQFLRFNAERGEYGDGDVEEMVAQRVELAKKFEPHCFERKRPNGQVMEVRGTPVPSGGFVTTYTDITERRANENNLRKREQELTEQNELFNSAIDNMTQGLGMFDSERRLVVCNKRLSEIYDLPDHLCVPGTPGEEILKFLLARGDIVGVDPEVYVKEWRNRILSTEESSWTRELSGGRTIAITHKPMSNGGWVATHEDRTQLREIQARLEHMAHHDELTQLPNRAVLRQRVEQCFSSSLEVKSFAILCLDLDRFKSVNDTLGHPMGDKLLQIVAKRLKGCVEEADTIIRLGGDEFAIIQMSEDQPRAASELSERVCTILAQPFELETHQVVVGTSIGVAIAPRDGTDPDQLLKNADMALYRAKNEGRGSFRFFEFEMDTSMRARRSLELDLRKAFNQGEFELHYQPLVNLASNEVTGFEALLRWNHEERGNVSPTEFIPIAEEIGLIIPLGEWVVNKACMDAKQWPGNTKIAVNLSPLQFRNENLIEMVFKALARSHLPPSRLELEITERVLLDHNDETLATLHALRDLGVRISMDDFGTGYSSLSYLRSFPFDKIKIDRSFINDLSKRDETAVIVSAVASLSQNLGMVATAEGVETQSQRDQVSAAGYTEMQGFLFSAARPAEEITRMYFSDEDLHVALV
ncbi:MAG: PAS-domain containing protein [Rhizobiaceae bacterium]|nr:PAS-domain containing protein [Rhizobiaceae bacterium]